jgi:hypothetical protein
MLDLAGLNPTNAVLSVLSLFSLARNDAAAPSHRCPHTDAHGSDIVRPLGIGISLIADMDARQTIVIAVVTAKSSADAPKKA